MVLTKGLLGHETALWKSRKSLFCSFITNVDPIPAVLTIDQQKDRGGHGLAAPPSGTAMPWVSVVVPCGKATLITNQHVTTFAATSHRNGAFRVILYLCPSVLQILCCKAKTNWLYRKHFHHSFSIQLFYLKIKVTIWVCLFIHMICSQTKKLKEHCLAQFHKAHHQRR